MKKRHKQKLSIISIILFLLLNAPILLLFNSAEKMVGLPLIYFYIFLVWFGSVVSSFLIFKRFDE